MAKKLTAGVAKKLKAMKINAKTEEAAREELLERLKKEGIEGMEDESLETLMDMVSSFSDEEPEVEEETEEEEEPEEVDDEETEADELADEVEQEEADETEPDEEEDEEPEVEEETEEEEEETEEEEEPKKPVKPVKKAKASKSVKPEPKKAKTTEKTTTIGKAGVVLDLKNNEEDRNTVCAAILKMFPAKNFVYDYTSHGVTVKYKGENGKRAVFSLNSVRRHADDTITCDFCVLIVKEGKTEIFDELGIDYTINWLHYPIMKKAPIDEVVDVLGKLKEQIWKFGEKIDGRLGSNRKKMEESLNTNKSEKKAAKKPAKTEEPKTTAKKAVAKKKTAK